MDVSRSTSTALPPGERELLKDPEGAALLAASKSRFAELQKEPDFPKPIWLGPRGKRHVRSELLAWAFARREVQK
jgi:predicted DNA-binding transcriptional regulator AlpA